MYAAERSRTKSPLKRPVPASEPQQPHKGYQGTPEVNPNKTQTTFSFSANKPIKTRTFTPTKGDSKPGGDPVVRKSVVPAVNTLVSKVVMDNPETLFKKMKDSAEPDFEKWLWDNAKTKEVQEWVGAKGRLHRALNKKNKYDHLEVIREKDARRLKRELLAATPYAVRR